MLYYILHGPVALKQIKFVCLFVCLLLILWKHISYSGISETSGMKYISTIPNLGVCCAFIYNLPLCKNHLIIILLNSDTIVYVITT